MAHNIEEKDHQMIFVQPKEVEGIAASAELGRYRQSVRTEL